MEFTVACCDGGYVIGRGQAVHKDKEFYFAVVGCDKFKRLSVLFNLHVAGYVETAFLFFIGAVFLFFPHKGAGRVMDGKGRFAFVVLPLFVFKFVASVDCQGFNGQGVVSVHRPPGVLAPGSAAGRFHVFLQLIRETLQVQAYAAAELFRRRLHHRPAQRSPGVDKMQGDGIIFVFKRVFGKGVHVLDRNGKYATEFAVFVAAPDWRLFAVHIHPGRDVNLRFYRGPLQPQHVVDQSGCFFRV